VKNRDRSLVLRGGRLVDVRGGEIVPDMAIVVEDGRIVAVGRTDAITLPPGAQVEDVSNAWLIPGLVDMHVHLTSHSLHPRLLPLYLAQGVTAVRDVGGYLTVLSLLRDDLGAQKRIGPHLQYAGPILDGIPPLWPQQSLLVDTPARARSVVQMLVAQGVDCIKVYNCVPEHSLETIVAEAHMADRPVIGHIPRTLTMTRAIEIGMDCLEHIRVTGRELLPLEEAEKIDPLPVEPRETLLWERFDLRSPGLERLVARLVEARVFLDPTLIIDAAMSFDCVPDEAADELERQLPEEARSALRREDWMAPLRPGDDMAKRAQQAFERRLEFVGMCNAAGVRLLSGTDTFGPGALLPGVSLHNEFELLQRCGLSPLQVLRAATITAAEALGVEETAGTLEEGKRADIVVLDANPLADARNTRKVRLVLQAGRPYTPAELVQEAVRQIHT